MSITTENCQENKQLTLHDPSQSPLEVQVIDLNLIQQNNNFNECRLTFEINPELYQRIDTEALFNLKQELRGPFSSGSFQPQKNIKIEATLKPELLAQIREQASNSDEILTYLLNLSQDNSNKTPESPLFTENWFALQLQQSQESGETGYRTFWAYSTSAITQESISNGQISQAMVNFVKDWTDADISTTESAISEVFDETLKGFEEWAENSMLEATEEVIAEIDKEATNLFEEWVSSYEVAIADYGTRSESIFSSVVNFFIEDDWQFAKLETEPALRLAFQGKNGQWTCYAKAREQQQQFAFYSVCPINAPENKHQPIIEFITRANYGMIMGNFEFDFTTGEIRYKTSIDVEGDNLSFALIKQMVYANVMMMDEYLPGIMGVIEGEVEVKEAISLVES
ncbi:MAG: YbjN domain-containing protein [Cyanobacteria bacterium J06635_10]